MPILPTSFEILVALVVLLAHTEQTYLVLEFLFKPFICADNVRKNKAVPNYESNIMAAARAVHKLTDGQSALATVAKLIAHCLLKKTADPPYGFAGSLV